MTVESPVHGPWRPVERKLPGKPRRREDALREFEDGVAEERRRWAGKEMLMPFFIITDAKTLYRWRVLLECGCVHEKMSAGKDADEHLPYTFGHALDPISHEWTPDGQHWCRHDDPRPEQPYRDVIGRDRRQIVSSGPDPEEKPDWCVDDETWAKIRRIEPETRAQWRVELSCGHFTRQWTPVEWDPADGPTYLSLADQRELIADLDAELGRGHHDGLADILRSAYFGSPRPAHEERCWTCTNVSEIVAFERVGWLVPREKPPSKAELARQRKTVRERREKQLKKLEKEAALLREQLEKDES